MKESLQEIVKKTSPILVLFVTVGFMVAPAAKASKTLEVNSEDAIRFIVARDLGDRPVGQEEISKIRLLKDGTVMVFRYFKRAEADAEIYKLNKDDTETFWQEAVALHKKFEVVINEEEKMCNGSNAGASAGLPVTNYLALRPSGDLGFETTVEGIAVRAFQISTYCIAKSQSQQLDQFYERLVARVLP